MLSGAGCLTASLYQLRLTAACVARNRGYLYVAAFTRMRAFPAFPHSGECGYRREATATHGRVPDLDSKVIHWDTEPHVRRAALDELPVDGWRIRYPHQRKDNRS